MQGPLGIYSPNLDPLTALGIEARSDEERNRYAELQVQAESKRVGKTLAYQRAYDAAWKRLYPGQQRVNMPGAKAPGAGNRGSGRLAVFVKAECPSCEQRVRQLQAAGTAFDLYMVGSRQEDARIRQWATQAGIDAGRVRSAPSRSTTTPGAGCRSACPAICPPWCARSTANGSGSNPPCRLRGLVLGLSAHAAIAFGQEVPPPAYQLAAQQAGVPSPVLYAVALQESGARLRGRLIPGRGRSTSPAAPNATPRGPRPAPASAGRSPARRPTASTPASARSTSATTRTATRIPASCSTRTATSPSPRKSCRSSTRRARTGWSPSAATTAPRAGRPPPATAAASTST
jgi:integrating conjugative element protein (TIGR03759 family)